MATRRRGARGERGASAVEFALLLPLMLLIIAGIVDFGRAFFIDIQLANAAREGARAAVVSTLTAADIQTRANAAAPGLTLTYPTLDICPNASGQATVKVQVQLTWVFLRPAVAFFGGSVPSTRNLSSTAVMKCGG